MRGRDRYLGSSCCGGSTGVVEEQLVESTHHAPRDVKAVGCVWTHHIRYGGLRPQPNRRTDLWSVATDQRSVLRHARTARTSLKERVYCLGGGSWNCTSTMIMPPWESIARTRIFLACTVRRTSSYENSIRRGGWGPWRLDVPLRSPINLLDRPVVQRPRGL